MKFVRLQDLEGRQWDHIDPAQVVLKAKDVAVWTDAQALLERARSDAERIRLEATQAFESEKSRGYEEGLQEARLEQTERMIENATRMVEFFASVEQRMVGLVMDAVRRIIADYSDAERVMAVVRSGLHVMRNQKQLTLRLAPEHAPQVSARAAELLQSFPGIGLTSCPIHASKVMRPYWRARSAWWRPASTCRCRLWNTAFRRCWEAVSEDL
jgi:type III secretion system HrpE/YscL family protein